MKSSDLRNKYPTLKNYQPLMLGVHVRLKKKHPELTDAAVRRFLKRHTSTREYLENLTVSRARRYTLSGKPVGWVKYWEKARARSRLAELEESQKRQIIKLRKAS